MSAVSVARWLVMSLSGLLLLGCPPQQELTLYNNSGEDLFIRLGEERVPWKHGRSIRFGGNDGLDWNKLDWEVGEDGVRDPQLMVMSNNESAVYRLAIPGLSGDFLDRSTGLYRRALQMQPDRKLYAVHVGSDFPADPPAQPEGLPLVAQSRSG